MRILAAAVRSMLLAGCLAATASAQARPPRQVFLVPMPAGAAWQDFAFLAATSASSAVNAGRPLVLAVAEDGALAPEAKDFLARYRPTRLFWIADGPQAPLVAGFPSERVVAPDADAVACAIAERFFARCACVIVVSTEDYSAALCASVLAARTKAPLLFSGSTGVSATARAFIEHSGARQLVFVGRFATAPAGVGEAALELLPTALDVARWMRARGLAVEYFAASAPADRSLGPVRKLSLAAAVLAAGREGAVVPVGEAEALPRSANEARAAIHAFHAALGGGAQTLCLVAHPETIPPHVVPSTGIGIDLDPPSDLEYGNTDADPFVELDLGRFVAADGPAGALLAARSLAYPELLTPAFAGRFATAEWESVSAPLWRNLGFEPPAKHERDQPIEPDSPLARVAVLAHAAHSSWLELGATYKHDSRVLLAPSIVESAGCSPASLDQDPERRSVALRLLRNGAVAFVGNVRRGIAEQELYRSEFWNGVLAGASLGRAHRDALNRMQVALLTRDEERRGSLRYQLYNAAFYGDPALRLHLPRKPRAAAASVRARGREVTVEGPAQWWRSEMIVPLDWNYDASPTIWGWRGAGVGVECSWDGAQRRNAETLFFTAELRTERPVEGIELVDSPPPPLGWDGRHVVDEHADGSRSIYFRVRLIDGEMATGEVRQQLDRLRFHLRCVRSGRRSWGASASRSGSLPGLPAGRPLKASSHSPDPRARRHAPALHELPLAGGPRARRGARLRRGPQAAPAAVERRDRARGAASVARARARVRRVQGRVRARFGAHQRDRARRPGRPRRGGAKGASTLAGGARAGRQRAAAATVGAHAHRAWPLDRDALATDSAHRIRARRGANGSVPPRRATTRAREQAAARGSRRRGRRERWSASARVRWSG